MVESAFIWVNYQMSSAYCTTYLWSEVEKRKSALVKLSNTRELNRDIRSTSRVTYNLVPLVEVETELFKIVAKFP